MRADDGRGRYILRPRGLVAIDDLVSDLRSRRPLHLPAFTTLRPGDHVVLDYLLTPTLTVSLRAEVVRTLKTGVVVQTEEPAPDTYLVIELARQAQHGPQPHVEGVP